MNHFYGTYIKKLKDNSALKIQKSINLLIFFLFFHFLLFDYKDMARIAEDSDFESLKQLVFDMNGWGIEIDKSDTKVWTKPVDGCNFQMVKIHTILPDVTAETLYDVRRIIQG